ncbi:MAG: hypothetical protein IPL46_33805 [Saprospiraceae bacterium]|nr:hypothetical protein [Saprospiraceae bacterium]
MLKARLMELKLFLEVAPLRHKEIVDELQSLYPSYNTGGLFLSLPDAFFLVIREPLGSNQLLNLIKFKL